MRRWFLTLSAVALIAAAAGLALAAVPATPNDQFEIKLPEFDLFGTRDFAATVASRQVEQSLAQRYGGEWQVYAWNAQSHTPRWVYGDAPRVGGALRGGGDVEQLARQVLAANADVLGVDAGSLRLTGTPHVPGKWAAHFVQTYHGVDVQDATVCAVFGESGKLVLMGSNAYRDIEVDPTPSLSAAAAADVARRGLPFDPATDRLVGDASLLVVPVALSPTMVEHHLAWRVTVRTAQPLGEWVTLVDAHDGTVLARTNAIQLEYLGGSTMPVHVNSYCDGSQDLPVPYMNLTVSGVGQTTTGADGAWHIAGSGGDRTVTGAFVGPYFTVINFNGAEAAYSGTAQENVPLTVAWTSLNSRADERDTFEANGRIRDFFELFDPGYGYTNAHHNAYVNRNDGYCPGNAWWDPSDDSTNFCAGSSSYGNTGEMQQVTEHEFGHGIQDDLLNGTQGNQGLGEGNGDILGNLLTQDPIIGRGFYVNSGVPNCVSGIRNSLNSYTYPDDVVGQEIHFAGQVIAGFNWDAMVLLQAQYGAQPGTVQSARDWHFGRMLLRPTTQPDQVLATFTANDDNDNLGDGTPDHASYCEAAQNHGFTCPEILVGVFVYHDGLPYQTHATGSYQVTCTVASLGGGSVVPSSVAIHYMVDGGAFQDLPMSPQGEGYAVNLPAAPLGSEVRYYISAMNDLGATGTSPRNAPTDLHYFQVGDQFPDDMELLTAWSVGVSGDNAASGAWERADPQPTTNTSGQPVQPGDDHTAEPGVLCWVTDDAGGTAGNSDVDGGHTTLVSPAFDLTGGEAISLSYWRWYTNNMGNSPNEDYWTVQITADGGLTWSNVEHTTESSNGWVQVVYDVSAHFPQPGLVQLRFIADDAGSGSLVEALVDDFLLVGTFGGMTPVEDAPQLAFAFDLSQNHPNPFNPRTTVKFSLDRPGPATLNVYDAKGQLVRVLVNENLAAGEHAVIWNGDDQSGRPVASGVYFYRLDADGRSIGKRMLLVK